MQESDKTSTFPDFICVGAQKAATTSFDAMIRKHPDVFMPKEKELHYFDKEDYQYNEYSTYASYFEGSEKYKLRGEVTPSYLYFDEVPERILALLGTEIKIIILLRNPIDRAVSHYKMFCRQMNFDVEHELLTFEQAFYHEKERIVINRHNRIWYSYFDRGLYNKQVERYLELFPNIKIVLFEDFVKNSQEIMNDIYDFLGIRHYEIELVKRHIGMGTGYKYPKFMTFRKNIVGIVKKINFINNNKILRKLDEKCTKKLAQKPIDNEEKYRISDSFRTVLGKYFYEDICELEKTIG